MPPKACFFAWEVWWGKVLTMDQLKKRGFQMASRRPVCGKAEEVLDHLLIHCPSIWGLWFRLISILGLHCVCPRLAKVLLLGWNYFPISKKTKRLWRAAPLSLFWAIWKERNKIVFEDETFCLNRLKLSFLSTLTSWAGNFVYEDCSFLRILLCIL